MATSINIGYKYRPLDPERKEIRILWVRHQSIDDLSPLRCRLEHVSLLDNPCYAAISYAWGDPNRRKEAIIDNQAVQIPESANEALRNYVLAPASHSFDNWRARLWNLVKTVEEPFWIDVICINQSDLQERNAQVAIMGPIYSKATLGCVWLGTGNSRDAKKANTIFRKLLHSLKQLKGEDMFEMSRLAARETCKHLDSGDWRALGSVFRSSWFTRKWVIQEVLLPRIVMCRMGACIWDWHLVSIFASAFTVRGTFDLIPPDLKDTYSVGLLSAIALRFGHKSRRLTDLLLTTTEFETTDPRDQVYSLLGLVEAGIPNGLTVDYNLPVSKILTMGCKAAIEQDRSLEILEQAFVVRSPENLLPYGNLPSWVNQLTSGRLDWTKAAVSDKSFDIPFDTTKFFSYSDIGIDHVLRVKGLLLDEIEIDPVNIIEAGNNPNDRMSDMKSILRQLSKALIRARFIIKQRLPHADEMDIDGLFRQLLLPDPPIRTLRSADKGSGDVLQEIDKLMTLPNNDVVESPADEVVQEFFHKNYTVLADLTCRTTGRALVTTTKGRIGNVWSTAKRGDWVCILFGCDIPLILRPEKDHLILIGDIYLPGAMKVCLHSLQLVWQTTNWLTIG